MNKKLCYESVRSVQYPSGKMLGTRPEGEGIFHGLQKNDFSKTRMHLGITNIPWQK